MLLENSLKDEIVTYIGKHPHATAADIGMAFGDKYSIQAIYQNLKKLQADGVVVKTKDTFTLKLSWVTDIMSFVQILEDNYTKSLTLKDLAPLSGTKHVWHFKNMVTLNNFWAQLLLILTKESADKTLYDWSPYPWYYIAHTEQEEKYLTALKLLGGKVYMIIGGRSYLYKCAEKYLDHKFIEYSFGVSPFKDIKDLDFNVINDYILTIKLDKKLLEKITYLYENTLSQNQLNIDGVLDIFLTNFKAKMILEYNPVKARSLKKKFTKFFGIAHK